MTQELPQSKLYRRHLWHRCTSNTIKDRHVHTQSHIHTRTHTNKTTIQQTPATTTQEVRAPNIRATTHGAKIQEYTTP